MKDYGSCDTKVLCHWLTAMEPIAFSEPNLKSLRPPGHKEIPQTILLEYFEFATGMEACHPINKDERIPNTLTNRLCQTYADRDRPASRLKLPVEWKSGGWYGLAQINKLIILKKVHNNLTHSCSIEGVLPKGTRFSDLSIELNFSELRAIIKGQGGKVLGQCERIMQLATGQTTEMPLIQEPNHTKKRNIPGEASPPEGSEASAPRPPKRKTDKDEVPPCPESKCSKTS